MKAVSLNCPNCGAAISSDAPRCQFCESKLAAISCPLCFGMMFIGSRHCPRCGTRASEVDVAAMPILKCPRCRIDMRSIKLGKSAMRECEGCSGLWLEVAAFETVCADHEHQSAVLGVASKLPGHPIDRSATEIKVVYLPCPQCGELMNRINFARCSGVIVDVCRGHGTWFDRDELRQIVEFIRAGGLELSRQKEKRVIEFERQQLERDRMVAGGVTVATGLPSDEEWLSGISATRGLLKFLLE